MKKNEEILEDWKFNGNFFPKFGLNFWGLFGPKWAYLGFRVKIWSLRIQLTKLVQSGRSYMTHTKVDRPFSILDGLL